MLSLIGNHELQMTLLKPFSLGELMRAGCGTAAVVVPIWNSFLSSELNCSPRAVCSVLDTT